MQSGESLLKLCMQNNPDMQQRWHTGNEGFFNHRVAQSLFYKVHKGAL